jgi:N-acyl-D-aspartate/D-glutamate deacylase
VLDPDYVQEGIRILVTWSRAHPEMAGRDLAAVAADWSCGQRDAAERLLPAGAVYFQMAEEDVRRILAFPLTMIGSDGLPHDARPHPRLWGTFPRVIGHYARRLGLFTLEQAVHKMTGLPARQFGLSDRGELREGAAADLVVFDPETIIDRATYEDPVRASEGIELVMVNGRTTWRSGTSVEARAGRFLARSRVNAQ